MLDSQATSSTVFGLLQSAWHIMAMALSTSERCACLPDLRALPAWLRSDAGPPHGGEYPLYRQRGTHEREPVTLRVADNVQVFQVT